MVLFNPGDIVKFKPIERQEFDQITEDVEARQFEPKISAITFSLEEFESDINAYNKTLMEALNGD